MAVTSNMLPLSTIAPDFNLLNPISNNYVSLAELKSDKATVIMFICNHCPYVKHIQAKLVSIANKYQEQGFHFIAINSNDIEKYPTDSPEHMVIEAKENHYSFPYLFDETQNTAKAYQAACTPDLYVFDKNLSCVYRGRFDDSTPKNTNPVTGKDLCDALDAILAGTKVNENQIAGIGCSIKWKN